MRPISLLITLLSSMTMSVMCLADSDSEFKEDYLNGYFKNICQDKYLEKVFEYLDNQVLLKDGGDNIEHVADALNESTRYCRRRLINSLEVVDKIIIASLSNYSEVESNDHDSLNDYVDFYELDYLLTDFISEASSLDETYYVHKKYSEIAESKGLTYEYSPQGSQDKNNLVRALALYMKFPDRYIRFHDPKRSDGDVYNSIEYRKFLKLHKLSIDATTEETEALAKAELDKIASEDEARRIQAEQERLEKERKEKELREVILPNTQLLDHEIAGSLHKPTQQHMNFTFKNKYYLGRCGDESASDGGIAINGGSKHRCKWRKGTDGFVEWGYDARTHEVQNSLGPNIFIITSQLETNAKGGFRERGRDENQTARFSTNLSGSMTIPKCEDVSRCSTVVIISRKKKAHKPGIQVLVNGAQLHEDQYIVLDRSQSEIEIKTKIWRSGKHVGASGYAGTKNQGFEITLYGVYNEGIALTTTGTPLPSLFQDSHICSNRQFMEDDNLPNNVAASMYLTDISSFNLIEAMNETKCYADLIKLKIHHLDNRFFYKVFYLELYNILQEMNAPQTTPVMRQYFIQVRKFLTRMLVNSRLPLVRDRMNTRNEELKTLKLVNFDSIASTLELQKNVYANNREKLLNALISIRLNSTDQDLASDIQSFIDNNETFDDFFDEFLALLRSKQSRVNSRVADVTKEIDFYNFELNQFGKIMELE